MHSCVTSKNVKWCHLIWPTLYIAYLLAHYPITVRRDKSRRRANVVWWCRISLHCAGWNLSNI